MRQQALQACLLPMDRDVEAFFRRRCHKVAGDKIKLRVGRRELMAPACISRPKTRLADRIGHIKIMELMGGARRIEYRSHPHSICRGVRWEVQDDRDA